MKTPLMIAVVILAAVVQARAQQKDQREACDPSSASSYSTNEMVISFTPPLGRNATVRVFDDKGGWLEDAGFVVFVDGKQKQATNTTVVSRAFYPEKRFVATTEWTQCVQGRALRENANAPCAGWFDLDLKTQSSALLASKPPLDLVVDAPARAAVGVTVKLPMRSGGGFCLRRKEVVPGDVLEDVFDGEIVWLAVRRGRDENRPMPPPVCRVNMARIHEKGADKPRVDPDEVRRLKPKGGQAGAGSSANSNEISDCDLVKVVRK